MRTVLMYFFLTYSSLAANSSESAGGMPILQNSAREMIAHKIKMARLDKVSHFLELKQQLQQAFSIFPLNSDYQYLTDFYPPEVQKEWRKAKVIFIDTVGDDFPLPTELIRQNAGAIND